MKEDILGPLSLPLFLWDLCSKRGHVITVSAAEEEVRLYFILPEQCAVGDDDAASPLFQLTFTSNQASHLNAPCQCELSRRMMVSRNILALH